MIQNELNTSFFMSFILLKNVNMTYNVKKGHFNMQLGGAEAVTFQLLDDLLYLLSYTHSATCLTTDQQVLSSIPG